MYIQINNLINFTKCFFQHLFFCMEDHFDNKNVEDFLSKILGGDKEEDEAIKWMKQKYPGLFPVWEKDQLYFMAKLSEFLLCTFCNIPLENSQTTDEGVVYTCKKCGTQVLIPYSKEK